MPTVQRRPSGNYYVRTRVRGVQTTVTFATEYEAERFAADVDEWGGTEAFDRHTADEEAKAAVDAEMTLSEWAERHFNAMPHVSPATLEEYRRDWRLRWEPHLGDLKLSRITREHVTAALGAQAGADKSIANAWGTLAGIFKMAVLDGHLSRSPTQGVKLGTRTSHETAEHRYLTADEFMQVIADTAERYVPLVWTLGGTGVRWGEATALTAADVDLSAATIRVTKAWKRDRTKGFYVGPPKTPKAKRTITLPNEVVDALDPLVRGRGRRDLVFTNRNGDPVKHQPFYREHWVKSCTANIAEPRPRIHDLRHSHVAWLLARGVSLPVIQARLGHEKITTTIDTYGHLMPDLHIQAAEAASQVFASARPLRALE